jgi:hypothetical protein
MMISNPFDNDRETKQKLLEDDLRDLTVFAEKLESIFMEELWNLADHLLILTTEEFLNKYTKRMKIVFEEIYSETCFENKRFTSMVRSTELSIINNICTPSLNILEKNLKQIRTRNNNNDNFKNFLKHCVDTGDIGLHTCKNKFIKIYNENNKVAFVYCYACDVVYFDNFIHMWCEPCNKEYCSFALIDEKMLQPATWFKYHCRLMINEQMKCQDCETNFYLTSSGQLYCHKCRKETDPMKIDWVCFQCSQTFNTSAKIYNPNEFRAVKLALRDALIQKNIAKPNSVPCCKLKINDLVFFHKKDCEGILLTGKLNGTCIIVCSHCKTLTQIDKHYWSCPRCFGRFKNEEIYSIDNQIATEPDIDYTRNDYGRAASHTEVSSFKIDSGKVDNIRTENNRVENGRSENSRVENIRTENSRVENIRNENIRNENNRVDSLKNENLRNENNRGSLRTENILSENTSGENTRTEVTRIDSSRSDNNNRIDNIKIDGPRRREDASPSDFKRIYSKKRNISIHWHRNIDENLEKRITENTKNNNPIIEKKIVPTPRNKNLNTNHDRDDKSPNISVYKRVSREVTDKELSNNNIIHLNLNVRNMSVERETNNNNIKQLRVLPKTNSSSMFRSDHKSNDRIAYLEPIAEMNQEGRIYKKSHIKVKPTNHNSSVERERQKTAEKKNDFLETKKSLYYDGQSSEVEQPVEKLKEFNCDDFKPITMIGEGSFGKIYLVEDKYKNQFSMKKIFANDELELETFTQEYELVNRSQHPNILKILAICNKKLDSTTQALFILMEVGSSDWEKEIKNRKDNGKYYTENELVDILKQLAEALYYLQKKGISHRDIKPQNVLIFKNGVFKIADFGEAKQISLKEADKELLTMRGTELYMSPLLFNGLRTHQNDVKHNSYKSDVFSLALCMLYAMTLNVKAIYEVRFLYDSKAILAALNKMLGGRFSSNIINLLYKMLEVNEKNRYDFVELKKALSAFS